MVDREELVDFDDFFDTPGRSVHDSTVSEENSQQKKTVKSSPSWSAKKQNRNNSASGSVDKSSVSSERDVSPDYSSDSVTESDSDSTSHSLKRQKSKNRSRSASSRSGGSSASDSGSSYSSKSRDDRSRSSRKKGRHSLSRSTSTDRSKSGTATPDYQTSKSKRKTANRRRDNYSSVTSSSTYSGSEDSRTRTPSPRPKEEARRQAWGTEQKPVNSRKDRPKTAKRHSSDEKLSRANGSQRREQNGKNHYDTDSDITDVSPIMSPRIEHHEDLGKNHCSATPTVFQAMPLGKGDSSSSGVRNDDDNAIDMNILMKAVSELEKQKRVKSNTRRVMFEPLRARPKDKSNYTFSNDDTHRIEQENKRLLRQIMQEVHATRLKQRPVIDARVQQSTLTASAINRRRAQQRIENENLAFLKRLQKVKPSKGLSRQEQISSYNSTVLHGIPIATLHPTSSGLRSGCQSRASSVAGSIGRTRSLTSIHSAATASSFGTASRQSSRAGSRPTSAKKSVRERPPWNDRW